MHPHPLFWMRTNLAFDGSGRCGGQLFDAVFE